MISVLCRPPAAVSPSRPPPPWHPPIRLGGIALEGEPALGGTKIGIHPRSPLCRFCTSPRAFCRSEVKEQRPAEAGPAGTWWRSRKAEPGRHSAAGHLHESRETEMDGCELSGSLLVAYVVSLSRAQRHPTSVQCRLFFMVEKIMLFLAYFSDRTTSEPFKEGSPTIPSWELSVF